MKRNPSILILASSIALAMSLSLLAVPGAHAADVVLRGIQVTLNHLGFDAGTPDGADGPKTRAAIEAYYATRGGIWHDDMRLLDELQQWSMEKVATALAGPRNGSLDPAIVPHTVGRNRSFIYSPDGTVLAAYGNGVRLLDAESQRLLRTLGDCSSDAPAAFTPDSRFVATGCSNTKSIAVYEVATGRLVHSELKLPTIIVSIDISPDGRLIAGSDNSGVVGIWDLVTGDQLHQIEVEETPYHVQDVAFSPLGDSLVSCGSKSLLGLWNPVTGRSIGRLDASDDYNCETVIFAPDGGTLYAATTNLRSSQVRTWDYGTGQPGETLQPVSGSPIVALTTSPDGQWIAAGGWDLTARVWQQDGTFRDSLEGFERWIESVSFTPSGGLLATDGATAIEWNFESDIAAQTDFNDQVSIPDYEISDDGDVVTFRSRGSTSVWDLATIKPLTFDPGLEPISRSFTYSADRQHYIARHDGAPSEENHTAHLVEAKTNRVIARLEGHSEFISITRFSPDDKTILTAGWDGQMRLWDGETGAFLTSMEGNGDYVQQTEFFPDSSRFVSIDNKGNGLIWAVASGKKLGAFTTQWTHHVTFSPDGSRFVTSSDAGLEFFDSNTLEVVSTFDAAAEAGAAHVSSVRFDVGSSIVRAVVGRSLYSWDSADGTLVDMLPLDADITSATGIPGTEMLMAASRNSGRWLLDAQTGRKRVGIFHFKGGEWVAMTPDGFFDASEHGAENLNAVRGLEFVSQDNIFQALYRPDLVREALAGDPAGKVATAAALLDLEAVIASGGAPRVEIASPVSGSELDADLVEVAAQITDQGGGIGRVEWRVNGITLGINGRGFDRLTQPEASQTPLITETRDVVQTLSLDPGANLIEIVAYNGSDLIASDPVSIEVNWTGATASTPPRLYVLSVGVDDYWDSRLQLNYAASDASAIAAAFETAGEGLYESVETTVLLNEAVTVSGLDAAFASLSQIIRPRDVFVLFMAGHGKTEQGRYYFLPQDFRYVDETSVASGGIDQDQFQQWLSLIPARKSLLLYDTCDSGSLTGAVATRGLEEVAALARMTRAMGRTVLSASTDDAPALEGYQGHGVFTYALLQALGDGDANSDGTIDVTELAGSIDRSVPEISFATFNLRQIPQMSIVGSDFPVVHKATVLHTSTQAPGASADFIPDTPTHVVVLATESRLQPTEDAVIVQLLPVGSGVRVIEVIGEWAVIARSGVKVGYVKASSLVTLQ